MDDFDPLKSPSSTSCYSSPTHSRAPLSISNPLYNSSYENHSIKSDFNRHDQDLLQEYGLDFGFAQARDSQSQVNPFSPPSNKVNAQGQWTKFD